MKQQIQFGKIYVRIHDGRHVVPIIKKAGGTVHVYDMKTGSMGYVMPNGFEEGYRLLE